MTGNRQSINTGEIHVNYVNLGQYHVKKPETMISPDELERSKRYRFEADSKKYVKGRYILRKVLSAYKVCAPDETIFEYSKNGKPGLKGETSEGLQFNVSHSGDMVVIAIARGRRIGIDIEQMRDDIPVAELAGRFFSARESAAIRNTHGSDRAKLFLKIWTRKEALLKATGQGIGGLCNDLDLLEVSDIALNGTRWQVRDLDISPGYVTALAVEGDASVVNITQVFT